METGQQFMKEKRSNIKTEDFKNTILSIQLGLNGLSFCVLNTFTQKIIALEHHPFSDVSTPFQLLEHIITVFQNEDSPLHGSFEKVVVLHVNNLSTFVPKPLFSDKNLSDYLKYNIKILENDYVTFDVVPNNDMVNVYVPYVNINNYFFEKYGSFEYNHFSTILVEHIINTAPNTKEKLVYVHVSAHHFEILVIEHRKLIFYNSFEYFSKEDYSYYLLFTIEQLQLNTDTLTLYLLGDVIKDDDIYAITYTYIRNVSFLNVIHRFSFENGLTPKNNYSNFTLLHHF